MASETHVWLLHAGRPASREDRSAWVRRAWKDPAWSPGMSAWWRGIWAWWQGRKEQARLALPPPPAPALRGPVAESPEQIEERLVDELQRHLGPSVRVRLVPRWPEDALAAAGRSLSMGVRVVLLPLTALPDSARSVSLMQAAVAELGPRRKVARAPYLTVKDGLVDVLSATLREGIIELGATGPVPVLFAARAASQPGLEVAHALQAERLAQSLASAARLAGPAELAFHGHSAPWGGPEPRVQGVLRSWAAEGHTQALLLSLDAMTESPDTTGELDAIAAKAPLRVHRAPTPAARPLFVRCLASARRAAETRAGWDTE